jgi:hypothetical protein
VILVEGAVRVQVDTRNIVERRAGGPVVVRA